MLGLAVLRPSQSGAGDEPWHYNVLVAPVPPPPFFFFLSSLILFLPLLLRPIDPAAQSRCELYRPKQHLKYVTPIMHLHYTAEIFTRL